MRYSKVFGVSLVVFYRMYESSYLGQMFSRLYA